MDFRKNGPELAIMNIKGDAVGREENVEFAKEDWRNGFLMGRNVSNFWLKN
jgi:hypothetical protein